MKMSIKLILTCAMACGIQTYAMDNEKINHEVAFRVTNHVAHRHVIRYRRRQQQINSNGGRAVAVAPDGAQQEIDVVVVQGPALDDNNRQMDSAPAA